MGNLGLWIYTILWTFLWTYFFFNLYAKLSFRILGIKKTFRDVEVALFLLLLSIIHVFLEIILFGMIKSNHIINNIIIEVSVGFLTYYAAYRYWRLSKRDSVKIAVLFVLFEVILMLLSFVIKSIVTIQYDQLINRF